MGVACGSATIQFGGSGGYHTFRSLRAKIKVNSGDMANRG